MTFVPKTRLINAKCEDVLRDIPKATMAFWDPPDNISLKYIFYKDNLPSVQYSKWIAETAMLLACKVEIVWVSFNVRHTLNFTNIFTDMFRNWNFKPCVQTFTFGQHNQHDLSNCHRPLWRFSKKDAVFYPDQIREQSWRQEHGDSRADPRGRVPGDVFNFPRVTGNSKQRRKWHPTQLHEDLIERCILLSTQGGDTVIDPCAGTGTVLRVCKRLLRNSISIEIDTNYCSKIGKENEVQVETH